MKDTRREIQVMGIANLTDDSFYSGSRLLSSDGEFIPEVFASHVRSMISEGASIIDLGACSTRPGSDSVNEETEWKRLEPALKLLKDNDSISISIDTFRPEIVRRAHALYGPFIVNDISGGSDEMLSLTGKLGLTYIATHSRGNSKTMQSLTDYTDVTAALKEFFANFSARAERFGIHDWILDPGYGFAKTIEQNWQLLRDLPQLEMPGHKILAGVSRKSMIWKASGITPQEALPGTQVAHLAALQGGADILRVHDVAEAVRTIHLWRLLENGSD